MHLLTLWEWSSDGEDVLQETIEERKVAGATSECIDPTPKANNFITKKEHIIVVVLIQNKLTRKLRLSSSSQSTTTYAYAHISNVQRSSN